MGQRRIPLEGTPERDKFLTEVLARYKRGLSVNQIAGQYGVSYATAHKWLVLAGATFRRRGYQRFWERIGVFEIEGIVLFNAHQPDECEGRVCVLHNPTDHSMRKWRLLWRDDRGIFERLCPKHGVGHPDPDQFAYWHEINQDWQGVHGCCGCCGES